MIYLLLFLTLVSCGKKKTIDDFYSLNNSTFNYDSDGDGINDWDEINNGQDPYIANVEETFPVIENDFKLTQNDGVEIPVRATTRRTIRKLLLQKSRHPELDIKIPNISQLEFNFAHTPSFWRARVAGKHFTKINSQYIKTDVEPAFITHPIIVLNSRLSQSDIFTLEEKTYRVIISTAEQDKIYRVSTTLSLKDFFEKYRLYPATQELTTFDIETNGWKGVGLPKNLDITPPAGSTYAIVYGTNREFNQSIINNLNINLSSDKQIPIENQTRINTTIFISWAQMARIKEENIKIALGNNPDHQIICKYTVRTFLNRTKFEIQSFNEISQYLDLDNAGIYSVEWVEAGTSGYAINLILDINNEKWKPQFKKNLYTDKNEIGVIKSTCEGYRPVKKKTIPKFTDFSGFMMVDWHL